MLNNKFIKHHKNNIILQLKVIQTVIKITFTGYV